MHHDPPGPNVDGEEARGDAGVVLRREPGGLPEPVRAGQPQHGHALAGHSVHGADATVAFVDPGVGARIVETMDGSEDATWGTVSRWEPGEVLAFTWRPGHGHDAASRVLVTFTTVDGGTLVRLEHSGWEAFGERAPEARASYKQGWPVVLGAYAALVAA